MIILDSVAAVSIGRLNSDGITIGRKQWIEIHERLTKCCMSNGHLVVIAEGEGLTSDREPESLEDCVIAVVVNPVIEELRTGIGEILVEYGLSSACCAFDTQHVPVAPFSEVEEEHD